MADAMGRYLKEIGRYPLLTAEQEITLSRRVQRMVELNSLDRELTARERREQASGQRAVHQMMVCNLRLVVSVAKRYVYRCRSMDLADLIQEGSHQLHRAVVKFDPAHGCKFSTYAYWWLRQAFGRSIELQDRLVRLPIHVEGQLVKARMLASSYMQEHGEAPSMQWLADQLGRPADQLAGWIAIGQPPTSLDAPLLEDGAPLLSLIPNAEEHRPSPERAARDDDWRHIRELMEFLEPRQRELLLAKYGIDSEPESMASMAKRTGTTRENIRQHVTKAENRLRLMANCPPLLRAHRRGSAEYHKVDEEKYKPMLKQMVAEGASQRAMSAALRAAGRVSKTGAQLGNTQVRRMLERMELA